MKLYLAGFLSGFLAAGLAIFTLALLSGGTVPEYVAERVEPGTISFAGGGA